MENNMQDLKLQSADHQGFAELCALYPTGSLSKQELRHLRQHVEQCHECRIILARYRQMDEALVSALVTEHSADRYTSNTKASAKAKGRLLDKVERRESQEPSFWAQQWGVPRLAMIRLACLCVVSGSLCVGVGYRIGSRNQAKRPQIAESRVQLIATSKLVSLRAEQKQADERLKTRDAKIEELTEQIGRQSSEIGHLREALQSNLSAGNELKAKLSAAQDEQATMSKDGTILRAQLDDARARLSNLQEQLKETNDQRAADLIESASLKPKVDELIAKLGEKDSQVKEQQSLLSSDRDIRELMGARDLFIADVFDIDRDGKTKTPFGRVFYTKNKSLIFYAFDLDKQRDAHMKDVAFQAWGLNDADKKSPRNLGIFYMDNQANRRWVLKFDNPSVLEKINSVFVTVEPSGGSPKPSGRQLLFAYLEAQPNHP
jgi:anti-sigma-K factor RskA